MLLEPKETEIRGRKYILHKFPAVAGREILTQYPIANLPKLGNYEVSEELMGKLLKYVSVKLDDGREQPLETMALIDNHVPDAATLILLEKEMVQYNFDFLSDGEVCRFLNFLAQLVSGQISQMLTALLETSSIPDLPPSGN